MRLWQIVDRTETGIVKHAWETTDDFKAMEFAHSFAQKDEKGNITSTMHLYSEEYEGPAIPEVTQTFCLI